MSRSSNCSSLSSRERFAIRLPLPITVRQVRNKNPQFDYSDIQSAQIGECWWEYILQSGDGAMAHR
jgi:hypothetical protein